MKAVAARGRRASTTCSSARDCLQELGGALRERSPVGQVGRVRRRERRAAVPRDGARQPARRRVHACHTSSSRPASGRRASARAEELYGVLYDRGLRRSDTLRGARRRRRRRSVSASSPPPTSAASALVQVPTTLLAQVDAAVGGKVAVDFRAGKNYVGTFYQPGLVFADLATLKTLPQRELRSGAAEVAKYGAAAGGGSLLERVEKLARHGLSSGGIAAELVADCVPAQAGTWWRRRARGERRARRAQPRPHGRPRHRGGGRVPPLHARRGGGPGLASRRSGCRSSSAGCPQAEVERGLALLDGLGLPARLERCGHRQPCCALLGRDKKAGRGGVAYVLLEALGRPRLGVSVPAALEREAVAWLADVNGRASAVGAPRRQPGHAGRA